MSKSSEESLSEVREALREKNIKLTYRDTLNSVWAKEPNKRDNEELSYDLLPSGVLRRLAKEAYEGAKKHGKHNWRKGYEWSNCFNHAMEHLMKFNEGKEDEDHLAHAVLNLFFLMEYQETHPQNDDRYKGESDVKKES